MAYVRRAAEELLQAVPLCLICPSSQRALIKPKRATCRAAVIEHAAVLTWVAFAKGPSTIPTLWRSTEKPLMTLLLEALPALH